VEKFENYLLNLFILNYQLEIAPRFRSRNLKNHLNILANAIDQFFLAPFEIRLLVSWTQDSRKSSLKIFCFTRIILFEANKLVNL